MFQPVWSSWSKPLWIRSTFFNIQNSLLEDIHIRAKKWNVVVMGAINEFRYEHHTMIVIQIHERMTVYQINIDKLFICQNALHASA
jgi:hypothetical protein